MESNGIEWMDEKMNLTFDFALMRMRIRIRTIAMIPTNNSSAVNAAIGAAAAGMAASYSQRKRDVASGSAVHAANLVSVLDHRTLLRAADDDAAAYAALQRTWKKDCALSPGEIDAIRRRALEVPTALLERCHADCRAIHTFWKGGHCNPSIVSDAAVGFHALAGAARAAYQTALVNDPPTPERERFKGLLRDIHRMEQELLDL